nr:MAG TPA: hypothetical protein [Caudoviricetes sp.]
MYRLLILADDGSQCKMLTIGGGTRIYHQRYDEVFRQRASL